MPKMRCQPVDGTGRNIMWWDVWIKRKIKYKGGYPNEGDKVCIRCYDPD
jgi:hypothetical protein